MKNEEFATAVSAIDDDSNSTRMPINYFNKMMRQLVITATMIAIRSWLDAITAYQQTSGIRSEKSENVSNVFYSLNGQKVTEPRKGIYIVGGEKRIIE